jgi:hypothetical protein
MAIVIKTFTLTLENTCNESTFANIRFILNGLTSRDCSKTIPSLTTSTFVQVYSVEDSIDNYVQVVGDYNATFTL